MLISGYLQVSAFAGSRVHRGDANADRNVLLFVLYSIDMNPGQGETMIHCGR